MIEEIDDAVDALKEFQHDKSMNSLNMDSVLINDESLPQFGDSKIHERLKHSWTQSKDQSLGFGVLDEEEQLD